MDSYNATGINGRSQEQVEFLADPSFKGAFYEGVGGEQLIWLLEIDYDLVKSYNEIVTSCYYQQADSAEGVEKAEKKVLESFSLSKREDVKISISQSFFKNTITQGNYCRVGFQIICDDLSSELQWSPIYRTAKKIEIDENNEEDLKITIVKEKDVNSQMVRENYFKDKVYFTIYPPRNLGPGNALLRKAVVRCLDANTGAQISSFQESSNLNYAFQISSGFNLTNYETTAVILEYEVTDKAGWSYKVRSKTQYRSSAPQFGTNNTGLTYSKIRPLGSNDPFELSHSLATAKGTKLCGYSYKIMTNDMVFDIPYPTYDSESNPNPNNIYEISINLGSATVTCSFIIENLIIFLKEKIGILNVDLDNSYFIITALDAFGDQCSINSVPFSIDFREAPRFSSSYEKLDIGHDYYIQESESIEKGESLNGGNYSFLNDDSVLDLRMFNKGEGIIFKIPKAWDVNEGESNLLTYQLYVSENPLTVEQPKLTLNEIKKLTYKELFSIPINDLVFQTDQINEMEKHEFSLYRYYNTSTYTGNKYLYFRLDIVDTTGLALTLYSEQAIYMCRTIPAVFKLSDQTVTENEGSSVLQNTITITDLGGSAYENEWEENYYKTFKNFERNVVPTGGEWKDYKPKILIILQVSDNPTSWDSAKEYTIEIELDSTKKFLIYNIEQPVEKRDKFYCRYKIQVAYGFNISSERVYTSSDFQTLVYSNKQPTMAHRPNWVGINTSSYDPKKNEAFVVEEYNTRNMVVFKSADNTKIVKFNLTDGTIEGTTIDCGTWDKI